MNKYLVITFVFLLSKPIISQTKIVTLNERDIKWLGTPLVTCNKSATINIETTDTIGKYISFSFRNAKYTHIIDSRVIMFNVEEDYEDYKKFKKDLNNAIENIDSQDPISFNGINYEIYVTGNKSIWLYDSKKGYTGFFLKQATKLKEWVDNTEF